MHFKEQYQPGGYYFKRNDSRDNFSVIDHFEKWCFSPKNSFKKIDSTRDNLEQVKKVVDILKKEYPNL